MLTKYRQPVYPNDVGLDVLAYHRVLRKRGYRRVLLGKTAGPEFEAAVRTVQHNHHLSADGVIGVETHDELAKDFDEYGVYLYTHAKIRQHSPYVSPFMRASVVVGRVDMGVDYHGYGPIVAIGDAVVIGLGGNGWPGGEYLLYRLLNGPHGGHYIYVAEAIEPVVRAGKRLQAGDVIARFGPGAAPGMYPGIETGWGSSVVNEPLAVALGNTGGPAHSDSPSGLAFARFLHGLRAPAPLVAAGPDYPA